MVTVELTEAHIQKASDNKDDRGRAVLPYDEEITITAHFKAGGATYAFRRGKTILAAIGQTNANRAAKRKLYTLGFPSYVRVILPL